VRITPFALSVFTILTPTSQDLKLVADYFSLIHPLALGEA